jgi:hypothetical protein
VGETSTHLHDVFFLVFAILRHNVYGQHYEHVPCIVSDRELPRLSLEMQQSTRGIRSVGGAAQIIKRVFL